ncbi:MAG: hypothetical protein WCC06_02805 [Candidatus Aminicenantales bacterium]
MKMLSYLALILSGICLVLAVLSNKFFDHRIIIHWANYREGVSIFLLAAILFALYHLIGLKSK